MGPGDDRRGARPARRDRARPGSRPGPYALQAAIALLHAVAEPGDGPDWTLISDLYRALERQLPSAAVTVNRAAALARAGRPDDALRLLAPLTGDPRHEDWVALHAAHADALLRAGRRAAAAQAWDAAARHARTPGVRGHLADRRDGPVPDGTDRAPGGQVRRPDQVQA